MEWEHCKENIKPKREGRSISNINTTPKGTPLIALIQERQAQFEREIKEYSGNDELDVWMKYVHYMEDAYPEGDYLSNVGTIQFRLIDRFQNVDRYKHDIRLLRIFLSLANHSPDPPEVYAYCFYHNIVTNFSKFWYNWINCWIYKLRYDKALKICEKAIKIFTKTNSFKGMKAQILHLMDSSSNTDSMVSVEELRKAGDSLQQDHSQNQQPGPLSKSKAGAKSFNIFKDRNELVPLIPSMSTNPLETKTRTKENATQSRQRWKNVIADTDIVAPSGKVFSVFEENSPTDMGVQTFQKSTTALKAKKVAASVNPVQSVKMLNPSSNVMSTVAYQKSKVYPFTGDEWSFEELEATRRFSHKENSLINASHDSTGSKRSFELDPNDDNTPMSKKNSTPPLKSCLSTSKFGDNVTSDFNIENTIVSSTKKIIVERDKHVEEPVMAPNFSDAIKMKDRLSSSLNLSVRSEQSLFKTDFKKTVEDSLKLSSHKFHAESYGKDEIADASTEASIDSELVDATGGDFSFKGLQTSFGIQDSKSQFAIYEDTALRGNIGESKEPEIIKGSFSKKKLKLHTPLKIPQEDKNKDDDDSFEVFNPQKLAFGGDFEMGDLNSDGRPSDAFNIFKKSPNRSTEGSCYDGSHASYSLKKVAMTPCNNSTSSSYVPCTVEKMGKTRSSDTQVINKQVLNMLNDCSRISEVDEPTNAEKVFNDFKCPVQLSNKLCIKSGDNDRTNTNISFEPVDLDLDLAETHDKARADVPAAFEILSDNSPDPMIQKRAGVSAAFEIFSDNSPDPMIQKSMVNDTQPQSPFTRADFEDKKQLTPILEGSRESNCSSVESVTMNKTSNANRDKSVFAQISIIAEECENASNNPITISKDQSRTSIVNFDKSETFLDLQNNAEMTRRSVERTEKLPTTQSDCKQVQFEPLRETLFPDRTHRDLHVDVSLLKKVPRASLAPTEPVTDPYSQDLIERIIQSLDPPLFFKPHFNQFDDQEITLKREVQLGLMTVKNITKIGEGAFAKVYYGECVTDADAGTVSPKAFKIQSPPAPWEFYILTELMERMNRDEIAHEVKDMILPMSSIHVYKNASVLTTSLFNEGSLLDMMNHYRTARREVPQTIICTYALDMLRCVAAIHRTRIIHGDIKPDNWLLRDKENTMHSMSMKMTKSVVLIDFGRSIDMAILPPGSLFTVPSKTELFECIEMQTGRPWTYQIDYYGVLSCIHLMMHSEYMKVYYDKSVGYWKPTRAAHRRVDKTLFNKLFGELLNIPDCHSIPPLTKYIDEFEASVKRIDPKCRHSELKTHYQFMSQRPLPFAT